MQNYGTKYNLGGGERATAYYFVYFVAVEPHAVWKMLSCSCVF